MEQNTLEAAVERFTAALDELKGASRRLKSTRPLSDRERNLAVARIDQAITALKRVLGEDTDATGQR